MVLAAWLVWVSLAQYQMCKALKQETEWIE